jgi:electron transfer flavoprotein beta subunit
VKIAVCVKEVPDTTAEKKIDPSSFRLNRDSGDRMLNAYDLNAIEQALRIKEAAGDGEVVLVSMGPSRALESIRKGLAMGADRAVLVSDDAAVGSDLVATSYVLAKALERESPDLVLFGQQATDGDGAVMWAAVAERLRMPVVSQISELEVAGGQITAKRQTEFGYDRISAPLPAVLAVADSLNEPRYPSLKGIMGAKKKPQDVVSLADIGVESGRAGEAGSRTTVTALADPPSRGDTIKIEDDGSGAQKILEFLMERKLV